ncbi:MAG: AMP-binding protein [Streptosporangiales bacterium]|nr:AMP-binding protein [Streptosporangiales bacterium]
MREYSVPPVASIAESDNLTDTVFRRHAEEPDAVMFRRKEGDSWRDVTVRKFHDDVVGVAKGLIAAGVNGGDRVALMSRTRYEWTVLDYAIWTAAAVTVPIYETSSAEQVEWILSDSGTTAGFVETQAHEATVEEVRERVPGFGHLWRIDGGALEELSALGVGVTDEQLAERRASSRADDTATLIYTSGTTGRPKGCELTHRNLLFDIRNVIEGPLPALFSFEGRSTLLFLPLAHSFARIIQIGCVESSTVLGHTPNISDVVPDLEGFQPTFLLAVPRVFEKVFNGARQKAVAGGKGAIFDKAADAAIAYSKALDTGGPGLGLRVKHAVFDKLVYGKLRAAVGGRAQYAVSGGSALGARLGHFFRGIGLTIIEGYGLTETSAPTSVNPPEANKIGTVGRAFPGVSVKIGEDGELLFKGDHIMRGYWGNPDATKESIDDEGWLRTGDIGSLDDEGYISITGRKKEIIVTAGGKNVAPAVIEDRLRAHPLVSQCLVVGDNRPFIGCLVTIDPEALEFWKTQHDKPAEATVAELVDDAELRAAIDEAVADANKAVSRAEAIKKYTILTTDFTEATGHLTPSLKVKRNVVTKDFTAEIDAIYGG